MRPRRFYLAVAVVTLGLVTLTLWIYPSSTDFAASNPYWNGFSSVTKEFEITALSSIELLPTPAAGTGLIVIPYLAPSPADLDAFKRYIDEGGALLVLDDFGFGNAVLERLGVRARFSGQLLHDPLFTFKSPRLPRIADFPPSPVSEGVDNLILNHATVILGTDGMTVLAWSSPVSSLDTTKDGRREGGEPHGPFVVAATGHLGTGQLILVSDPSILLNSMLDLADNRHFVRNLFQMVGAEAQIYLDEAHLPLAMLDLAKDKLTRFRGALVNPLVAFILVSAGLGLSLALLWKSSREVTDE